MRKIITLVLLSACAVPLNSMASSYYFALITLDDAARKIIQQGNDKVLATRTEMIDGKPVHIIKVLTPEGRIQHIKIDAASGQTIK